MRKNDQASLRWLLAGASCLIAVFAADVTWSLGAVIGLFYVIVVVGAFFISARDAFILASIATCANVLGYAFAPSVPIPEWIVVTSRSGSVFATWLLIVTGIHFHKQSQAVIATISRTNARRQLALEEAEQVQRERVEELQLLTAAIPMMIGYVDRDEKIQFANAAYGETFAVPVEKVQGMLLIELVGNDTYNRLKPHIERVLRGKRVQFEEQTIDEEGVRSWLFQFLPRQDQAGVVIGFYTLVTDISGLKRSLAEVDRQREAVALFNRRGAANEMAAALAHEMNQPLGTIAVYSGRLRELLEGDSVTHKQFCEVMELIHGEALRAGQVVKRARMMVDDRPINPELIGSAELLGSVKQICGAKAASERVAIDICPPSGGEAIYGDRVQLQQVLVNLVSNAIDASVGLSEDRKRVAVSAQVEDEGAIISVTDWGPGLAGGTDDRVFKPHYTTKSDGLGIGLNIAQSIVSTHGGRLWATPNADLGVTFHVALPPVPESFLQTTSENLPLLSENP